MFSSIWELLLWITALLLISAPIIVGVFNWIIAGYFRAKEGHIGRTAGMFAKAIGEMLTTISEKKNKEEN